MAYQDIEDSRIYRLVEEIADEVWGIVISWSGFAKEAVGVQLVKSADSIGANVAESAGRFHPREAINFLYYSRGSAKETRWHLKRSIRRKLISKQQFDGLMTKLEQVAKDLNGYVNFQKTRILKEEGVEYKTDEPPEEYPDDPTN